jgi:tungstate transport system ATP-binding protein
MTGSICFENIEKFYGDRVLLSVDGFTMVPGECVLISGDNGAGKTTLLKIASGLLKPEKATVIENQVSLAWVKARSRLQRLVVYLHQSPYMFDASVYDNVAYGLRAAKIPKAQIDEQVWQSLHWGKLDHLTHRNARLLSGGEKQRVALTRARIITPGFLILDEPTASMDRRSKQQTYELVQQMQQEGMSIVISTHEIEPFVDIIDHHHYLDAGHLHEIDLRSRLHKRKSSSVVTAFQRREH